MNPIQRIQEWNELAGTSQELNLEKLELYVKLIEEEHQEWREAYLDYKADPSTENLSHLLKEVADKIVVETGFTHCLGVSQSEVLEAVNDSNYSKFPMFVDADQVNSMVSDASSKYGYAITIEVATGTFPPRIILRREDGKILKPNTYKEADLSKVIQKKNND